MRRAFAWGTSLVLLAACGGEPTPSGVEPDAGPDVVAEPLVFCDGPTAFLYDPRYGEVLGGFPDDYYTDPDASTLTGIRVTVEPAVAPWIKSLPDSARPVYEELSGLDGWGTSAASFLRFDGPVGPPPTGEHESVTSGALALLELGDDAPRRIPYEAQLIDDDQTVVVLPMIPLRPKTRHALVMTTQYQATDGGCADPGDALRGLLEGTTDNERLARQDAGMAEAISALGISPDDVSAAIVFTTQSTFEVAQAVAKDIRGRTYGWSSPPDCAPQGTVMACSGVFRAHDYRDDGIIRGSEPVADWELPVGVWLPLGFDGPHPTVVYGHGMNGSRGDGAFIGTFLADLGIAVIAVDALHHGDHPTAALNRTPYSFFDFLAIDTDNLTIGGKRLRDNLRQSMFDRLQLIELIRQAPDVTGDGDADLDVGQLAYMGISLGGIMAADLLATSGEFQAAVLCAGGARLISFIENGADFAAVHLVLDDLLGSPGEVSRMLPVLQTLIDAGDPVNYGPYVLRSRLGDTDEVPSVLLNMAVGDKTVPNSCSNDLARALDLPVVPPALIDVGLVAIESQAPVSGNMAGGQATAGYFHFDRVTVGGGQVELAGHDNVSGSAEALLQEHHFFDTWLQFGTPEIIDPYGVLETPAL